MKIEDSREALGLIREYVERRYAAGEEPVVRALPGETFYDPNGWRFAFVWPRITTVYRVGPRGGIEALYTLTESQLAYLSGIRL